VIRLPNQRKSPLFYDGLDSRLSCRDERLEHRIDQGADRLALPRRGYRDERSLDPTRLDAYKHAIGNQVLPGSLEGMNHALDCDSSK
jgi:hypothetical protein